MNLYPKRKKTSRKMNPEQAFELKRQGFHLVLGAAIAEMVHLVNLLYPAYSNWTAAPLALGVLIMLLIPNIQRELHISNRLLYHFEREDDKKTFPYKGAIFFGIGVIPPILLLPTDLACATIMTLSAGDSFSTIIGKFFGKIRIGKKTIEGTLAFIAFAALAAAYYTDPKTALTLALAGAALELIPGIDDNISIPWGITALCLLTRI